MGEENERGTPADTRVRVRVYYGRGVHNVARSVLRGEQDGTRKIVVAVVAVVFKESNNNRIFLTRAL